MYKDVRFVCTPIHADMKPCKATSFVTTCVTYGKGQSPRGAVHPACLSVSVTAVWFSNFCRQDDGFTGRKAVNNYKKSCFQMQKPPLSRNLRSKVLGGTPGLLAATKNEKRQGWFIALRIFVHIGVQETQCMDLQTPSVAHFKHFFTLLWRIFFWKITNTGEIFLNEGLKGRQLREHSR